MQLAIVAAQAFIYGRAVREQGDESDILIFGERPGGVSNLDVNTSVRTLRDTAKLFGAGEYGCLRSHQKTLHERSGDSSASERRSSVKALSAREASSHPVLLTAERRRTLVVCAMQDEVSSEAGFQAVSCRIGNVIVSLMQFSCK
jgi:hypothetical protein